MIGEHTRRDLLWRMGGGLGGVALASMLGQEGLLAGTERTPERRVPHADINGGLHHKAKVRRVIQLFMNGGVSQMDTFDFKPELDRRHGQKFDPGGHVEAPTSAPGNLMKSPFSFKQYGDCGRWVSSVFPEIATCVDDLAFLMAPVVEDQRARAGQLHDEHGLLDAGLSVHGVVAIVWDGVALRQPADLRRAARSEGAALQREG